MKAQIVSRDQSGFGMHPGLVPTLFAAAALILFFAAAPAAWAGDVVAKGSFTGKSNHVTTGGVSIEKTAEGYLLVLEESFSFDGAPDPQLGFGKNGYDGSTRFTLLKANSGKQVYKVPANIDVSQYNEVWVWCERFSVPLGVATLN